METSMLKVRRNKAALGSISTAILLAWLSAFGLLGSSVGAETFVVDDYSDAHDADVGDGLCATTSGGCTLRAAAEESNATAAADVIEFVGPGTVTLGGVGLTDPVDLLEQVVVRAVSGVQVVLEGTGIANTTPSTLIRVVGVGAAPTRFENLTFSNAHGRGLLTSLFAGPVEVVGCVFEDNMVDTTGLEAGGGAVFGGTATVMQSTFRRNRAGLGGAIAVGGNVTVISSQFEGNLAGSDGGAIDNGGTLSIQNSTIVENEANRHGGGIFNDGNLHVFQSVVDGNGSRLGHGGGIYSTTWFHVEQSELRKNRAGDPLRLFASGHGGGVYLSGSAGLITRSALIGNLAEVGGALYLAPSGGQQVDVVNTTIGGNGAANGGGVYVGSGTPRLLQVTVHANGGPQVEISMGVPGIGLTLSNSIVSRGTQGSVDCAGSVPVRVGNNLDTDGTCAAGIQDDAGLLPLQDFGEVTRLYPLALSSPAREAGDVAVCADALVNGEDQHGAERSPGAVCHLGAWEAEVPLFRDGFESGDLDSWAP